MYKSDSFTFAFMPFYPLLSEPFNLTNTARSVYDQHTFQRVIRVFRQSYAKLQQTGDVTNIVSAPF